jgi:predicted permease
VPVLFALILAPPDTDVGPDGRVYLFVVVVTLLAGAVSGLAPARHGMRGALLRLIKAGGAQAGTSGREGWLRSVFVGTQAAASIVLVVLAALLGRALLQASQTDPGFDLDRLAGIRITPPRSYDDARTARVLDGVLERVRTLPAAERVGLVVLMPGGGNEITRDGSPFTLHHNWASSEYFAAAGHRFIRGRPYSDSEAAGGSVAVITSNLASVFWGSANPVGDTLERVAPGLRQTRVVGVIEAATTVSLNRPPPAMIYEPIEASKLEPALIVRVRGDVAAALPTFRDAVHAVDAVVRPQVWPLRQRFDSDLARARMFASLAGLAGGLALLLSVLGLAGVTAFVVGQRTREIGVRMAIGATARDVVRGVLRDGLRPVVAGLAIGLVIALLSSHLIAGVLYGVSARDPIAVASAVAVLLATATVAVIVPARRAARVDPAVVLRE